MLRTHQILVATNLIPGGVRPKVRGCTRGSSYLEASIWKTSKPVKILLSHQTLETMSKGLSRVSVTSALTVKDASLQPSLVRYPSWASARGHWRQTLQALLKLWRLSREFPVLRGNSRGSPNKTGRDMAPAFKLAQSSVCILNWAPRIRIRPLITHLVIFSFWSRSGYLSWPKSGIAAFSNLRRLVKSTHDLFECQL